LTHLSRFFSKIIKKINYPQTRYYDTIYESSTLAEAYHKSVVQMRTPWELDGITLGTKETKKVSPAPSSAQKEKKILLECMSYLLIGCMNFLFINLFLTIFNLR
jgi:hypothetical protein